MILVLFILPLSPLSMVNFVKQPHMEGIQDRQYSAHQPILIADDSDFALLGFPGTGTSSDPYVIEGLNISRAGNSIYISQTSVFFVIRDCYLNGGVNFDDVENGQIENCIIEGSTYGIFLQRSEGIQIENNVIFGASETGIFAQQGGFIQIIENKIFANERGIQVNGADNSSIWTNRVYSNTRSGIEISQYTEFNEIFQNFLGWNVGPLSLTGERNGIDDGENNTWHYNRWSDFPPEPGGIGPYSIEGDANAIDGTASVLRDDVEPVIVAPAVDSVIQGNATAILNWTITEVFPFSYEIYQNGELVQERYLIHENIGIPLGGLAPGEYNFTIWVRDGYGNFDTLQQIVQVISAVSIDSIVLAGIGIGVILVVLIIWEKIIRPKRTP
jgi:parallel beta-helix repeat protein